MEEIIIQRVYVNLATLHVTALQTPSHARHCKHHHTHQHPESYTLTRNPNPEPETLHTNVQE